MTTAEWDSETARYLALSREDKGKWIASLLFALTIFARGTYTVGGEGLEQPERMRRFNELAHRVAGQLRQQADGIEGRPEDAFMRMVGEALAELGVDAKDIIATDAPQANSPPGDAFRAALNNACGEISEAARLSAELFDGEELKIVRRELARLMEIVDSQILVRLKDADPGASSRSRRS